jgi:adenylosuccinate lyase
MTKVIEGLGTDRKRLLENLNSGGIQGGIMAEPAYILLAEAGVSDAHEVIRRITLTAEKEEISLAAALSKEPEIFDKIARKLSQLGLITFDNQTDEQQAALIFFENPQRYCGLAAVKAKTLAEKYKTLMGG